MESATKPLVLDLVQWLAARPRPYGEVMEAWRTSCPRLTVWEDAVDAGLVTEARDPGGRVLISVTAKGFELLRAEGRQSGRCAS